MSANRKRASETELRRRFNRLRQKRDSVFPFSQSMHLHLRASSMVQSLPIYFGELSPKDIQTASKQQRHQMKRRRKGGSPSQQAARCSKQSGGVHRQCRVLDKPRAARNSRKIEGVVIVQRCGVKSLESKSP